MTTVGFFVIELSKHIRNRIVSPMLIGLDLLKHISDRIAVNSYNCHRYWPDKLKWKQSGFVRLVDQENELTQLDS